MKIENGTKNQLFRKVRRWDPLKTVSGSGFEKTWKIDEKTIGKSIVFDGLKPLKSIEKQTLFLTLGHSKKQWKIDAKMTPQSHKKWNKMERGGAHDRFILRFYWFWEKVKKLDFSMRFKGDQKTKKIDPWSAKGSKKAPQETTGGRLSRQGSRHSRLGIKRPTTRAWSHTPKGRRPGEFFKNPGRVFFRFFS